MSTIERPPIPAGDTGQQVAALRDYLFRLAGTLETAANAPAAPSQSLRDSSPGGGAKAATGAGAGIDAVRKNANELRALILKTARDVEAYADAKVEEYNSLYVAKSEYGTFTETITNRIETGARGVVESYGYTAAIDALQAGLGTAQDYLTRINGEVRRGYIEDPDSPGSLVFGIAISSSLRFSGATQSREGYTFYELEGSQTFGLYTATGWQFWIDGHKRGWFDSTDGMLHAAQITVEDALQFGADWRVRAVPGGELEIIYMGE